MNVDSVCDNASDDSALEVRIRVDHTSASCTSASRAAVLSAIRRMFSTSPSRNIVGIAHSSPSLSCDTR